jgi:hypothetical protein
MLRRTALLLLPLASLLAGCDMLGIETGPVIAAKKEAEGKAIGGACRHGLRAIEDCYTLNPKAQKSAVYAGWREMDEYLRETKSEGIVPVIPRKPAKPASAPDPTDGASASSASAADEGAGHGDKPGSGTNAHDTPPGAAERSSRAKRAATTH